MSYPGQVTRRHVLAGLALIGSVLAAIVVMTHMLVPQGQIQPPAEEPAEDGADAPDEVDPDTPGAVVCPEPDTLPPPAHVQEVGSSELIDCPQVYDGHVVAYEGEVIDVVLHRGDRAWVQLNDDVYSDVGPLPEHGTMLGGNSGIAVSIPEAIAQRVRFVGNQRALGDRLAIVGVFHQADPDDGGLPTIEAAQARVARVGHTFDEQVSRARIAVAGVSSLIALATAAVTWTQRRAGARS